MVRLKRRRVNRACIVCRKQKIRCDGLQPQCGTCQRRREHCMYEDLDEPRKRKDHDGPALLNCNNLPRVPIPTNAEDQLEDTSGVTAMGLASRPPNSDHDLMTEYFGDSSAVAFVQELQNSIKSDSAGPNLRSRRVPRDVFNNDNHGVGSSTLTKFPGLASLPPRTLADHLVSCYFSKIHSLYPFVHKEAFLAAYESLWMSEVWTSDAHQNPGVGLGDSNTSPTTFYFALNAIFASGCQFSNIVQLDREMTSDAFFTLCKPALDLNYLEGRADLAMCQTLLLATHYLQSSLTPNRCWHVIGTACRAAQALGLHSNIGDKHRSFTEVQIRRRVWHGCVMLDLAVSTMLGRPVMISENPVTPKPQAIDDRYLIADASICEQPPHKFSRASWFVETLKLHDILRKILSTLYDNAKLVEDERTNDQKKSKKTPEIQSIIEIDADLQNFKANLPTPLKWDLSQLSDDLLRERLLLKARFSYLQILLYRPILSRMLRENKSLNENNQNTNQTGMHSRYCLDCSVYCTWAAIELVSLVHQTCTTELASVWSYNLFYTFTAGSIILLAELSPSITRAVSKPALEESWKKCCASLDYLKLHHPAAEQCARSLTTIKSKCHDHASDETNVQFFQSLTSSETQHQRQHTTSNRRDGEGIEVPFPEDLFGNLQFDDDTFLDPYWFNLEF